MMPQQPDLLKHVPFTLIFVKTLPAATGGTDVVEVACVKIRELRIAETLHTQLNPGRALPEEFTRRTGLYNAQLLEKPELEAVLPELASFVERDFIVWANPPGRSNAVYRYFRRTQPKDKQLFLQTLAQKTLPDLERHTLEALAKALKMNDTPLLRAEQNAIVAAKIFVALLQQLNRQGIDTLTRLLDFCPPAPQQKRRTRDDLAFDRDQLRDYPTDPGVYFMKNRLGEVLYIGKAKNLRNRLRSYFQKQSRLPEKVASMIRQVTSIDITVVGSELEALLLEARLIKQQQPFYNRKIKDYQKMVFLKISMSDAYPKLSVSKDTDDPTAAYYGPFGGKSTVLYNMELLNRVFRLRDCSERKFEEHAKAPCMQYALKVCSGPCAGLIDETAYRAGVDDFIRYLANEPSDALEGLAVKRDAYAEALKFEKAASVQAQLEALEQLQQKSYRLRKAIQEHHGLIILPAKTSDAFRLLTVIQGQPISWKTYYPARHTAEDLTRWIEEALAHKHLLETSVPAPPIPKELFEEARLISQWIASRSDDDGSVVYLKDKDAQMILNEVLLALSQDTISPRPDEPDDAAWQWESLSQLPS